MMYHLFEKAMIIHIEGSPATLTGRLLRQAFTYAQEVRRYYAVQAIDSQRVNFKVLCVAWKLLQVSLVKAPRLYTLLIRSFSYAVTNNLQWTCFHQTQYACVAPLGMSYPGQQELVYSVWDVVDRMHHLRKYIVELMHMPQTAISAWHYTCPFVVVHEPTQTPQFEFGPYIKVPSSGVS